MCDAARNSIHLKFCGLQADQGGSVPRLSASRGTVPSGMDSGALDVPGTSCAFARELERFSSDGCDGAVLRNVCLSVGMRL